MKSYYYYFITTMIILIRTKPDVRNVICQCEPIAILCCIRIGILRSVARVAVRFTPELYTCISNCVNKKIDQAKYAEILSRENRQGVDRQEYVAEMEGRLQSDPIHNNVMKTRGVSTKSVEVSRQKHPTDPMYLEHLEFEPPVV